MVLFNATILYLLHPEQVDYWTAHPGFVGLILLFLFAFFPRVSMLFTIAFTFTWKGWLGWLFLPSFVVAYHAISIYGETNPILAGIACLWVLSKVIGFVLKILS